ncbi:MAG: HAMP domain-containing histidine kinase [Planctomycetes bacterium]|nr:HAMP domain-containing histidine kinase [Planctomycetota bacterium]
MSNPGTLSAMLAFSPNWWQETTSPATLGTLLIAWAKVCGWQACGLVWTDDNSLPVIRTVRTGALADLPAPTEVPDAIRRLRAGETTVMYTGPGGTGRVFAAIQPPGRSVGVLWAERSVQSWTDVDRTALSMTAKMVERSPAVATIISPRIESERLDQRLGDAAVIAGRMAHDFDNILTGIIGFSDLAVPLLTAGSQAAKFVSEISKVGQRGIVFTQQLHQLSRSGQVKPNPTAIVAVVAKEETRLKSLGIANLQFEKDIPAGLPTVAMEAGVLQTVLGHLIENAGEACPHGGLVRLTARVADLSENDAQEYLGKPGVGEHLLVTVTDNGVGMKPEVRRRLFVDPFYTTKVRHRGLGLAIVYRVLCAHRGGVQIEPVPEPGPGTQVRVVLPLATTRTPAPAGTPAGHAAPAGNASATAVRG